MVIIVHVSLLLLLLFYFNKIRASHIEDTQPDISGNDGKKYDK